MGTMIEDTITQTQTDFSSLQTFLELRNILAVKPLWTGEVLKL